VGLFDFPAPILNYLDGLLQFLPALFRLLLWGFVSGLLSMLLYALISNQARLSSLKLEIRGTRAELATSDGSFDELLQVVQRALGLSFKHLGLVLLPAFFASLPLVCVLTWASNQFGYHFPEPGTAVSLTIQPESQASELSVVPAGVEVTPLTDGLQVTWPDENAELTLVDGAGHPLVAIPPPAPVPLIHEKLWWNLLLGNPVGYLPAESPVKAVFIELPEQRHLHLGPSWLGHWLTVFFSALIVSALLTKVILKIE
jgi:hypothetical protein